MKNQHMVGLSVGIIKDYEIVWLKGYGEKNRNTKSPATEYTMYRLASVSKPITAILALQLYERNRLQLDSNIRNLVPEYPIKPQGTITTKHLLHHSSGIRHYEQYSLPLVNLYSRNYTNYDPITALDIFKNGSLASDPGTAYRYTTFGYNLLAAIVQRAAQKEYTEQFRLSLASPNSLPFLQPEFKWKKPFWNEASGYQVINDSVVIPSSDVSDITWKLGGGGYIGTVIDLAVLVKAFMDNKIFLSISTKNLMLAEHQIGGYGTGYGMGLGIGNRNGKLLASHSGAQGKTSSLIYFHPNSGDGVVLMSNTEGMNLGRIAATIIDEMPFAKIQGAAYRPIPISLNPPQPLFPANQATHTGQAVVLQCSKETLAYNYIYEWANNSSFNSSLSDTVENNNLTLTNLKRNSSVYWRVKLYNPYLHDTTTSKWSRTFRFQTGLDLSNKKFKHASNFSKYRLSSNEFNLYGNGSFEVEIYSIDGKLVERRKVNDFTNIRLFQSGLYYARCSNSEQSTTLKLLIYN